MIAPPPLPDPGSLEPPPEEPARDPSLPPPSPLEVAQARKAHAQTATGRFGADMQVSLVNDGPVTFWLEVNPN